LASISALAEESPRHVVRFNAGESASMSAAVAALGGRVDFVSETGTFAGVSGLSADAVDSLKLAAGVSDVFDDVMMSVNTEAVTGDLGATDFSALSIGDPAAAFRHNMQWNMRAIGADQAWAAGELGSPEVTVAIIDSGIDYDAYDMVDVLDIDRSKSFVPSDDAIINFFFPGRLHIDDLNGHGTNVATQVSSGGVLFGGVNSKTRLISVKVLNWANGGALSAVLAGIQYAADAGADVANLSIGARFGISKLANPGFVQLANQTFDYANEHGMVVVVSAGNDGQNMDRNGDNFRPWCEASHVICVGATGPTASTHNFNGPWTDVDAGAPYSNTGKQLISVTAPGGTPRGVVASQCAKRFINVFPNGTFTTPCLVPPGAHVVRGYVGTSQAAPHVAGVAAKLVEKIGKNKPAQIRHALLRSVDDLGAPGRDDIYGYGRINVMKAIGGR
jgi:subtilisin family serine protease